LAFDQNTRNRLQKFVSDSRNFLTAEFTRQLQANYGLDPKTGMVADLSTLTDLDNEQLQNAIILREMVDHYSAGLHAKSEKQRYKESLERIIREQAFTVLNRMGALRMAEARGFLLESIANGYHSKGFQLYRNLSGTALGETGEAYRCFLFGIFDEFSLDLANLFDRHSIQGRLFPRESALLAILEQINHFEIESLWAEDETIGWIYQYFNSQEERKKMRAESQAPRNSRELAVRNQFFTPRYVVEFLTDNTLGRIWYEMTNGKTTLVDTCRYLVRRPTEIFLQKGEAVPDTQVQEYDNLSQDELLKQPVYIPHRTLKDPRELRMLDPACGSMHFGLYAFDLYEKIYEEAWRLEAELGVEAFVRSKELKPLQSSYDSFEKFQKAIPKLIIEENIHGVDIDPRAIQIAGLSLWQRAHRSWHQVGIKPDQRPSIKKSNIVCAEPMPGEKEMLQEFTSNLNPPILGQLLESIFDKMELAGEAGTLLKIEEEIKTAIREARLQWIRQSSMLFAQDQMSPKTKQSEIGFDLSGVNDESFWDTAEERIVSELRNYADQADSNDGKKRLFAEDAAKGFAFIDLCRKQFDVVLMNPPFGLGPDVCNSMIKEKYPNTYVDYYASFVERGHQMSPSGLVGSITSRAFLTTKKLERWRRDTLVDKLHILLDLGLGVMDDAFVESCAYVVGGQSSLEDVLVFDNKKRNVDVSFDGIWETDVYLANRKAIDKLPSKKILYSLDRDFLSLLTKKSVFEPEVGTAREGMRSFDDERFLRLKWETPTTEIGKDKMWEPLAKGGEFSRFFSDIHLLVKWNKNGSELAEINKSVNGQVAQSRQASSYYRRPGCTYSKRSAKGFSVRILPAGCIIGTKGPAILSESQITQIYLLGWANSRLIRNLVQIQANASEFNTGIIKNLPWVYRPNENLEVETKELVLELIKLANYDETNSYFCGITGVGLGFSDAYKAYTSKYHNAISKVESVQRSWDSFIDDLYGISSENIFSGNTDDEDQINELSANDYISILDRTNFAQLTVQYVFGVIFGRWKPNADESVIDEEVDLSATAPITPFASEVEASTTFPHVLSSEELWDQFLNSYSILSPNYETSIDDITSLLKTDLNKYINSASTFFDFHLKAYSKSRRQAPIYWPLQTPSGSYTLWVYYHGLTAQTLYTCVNDFVEPKLKKYFAYEINSLHSKPARSRIEEKELEKLTEQEAQLKDFRDELLRLAKVWKPNLCDGVQITAAPLWKMFQHKPWQKKLKATWEAMERGDYDWAHLSFSIWPDRVLRKCHQDRSLAIAHEVEGDFWEEVVVPVVRRGKDTGTTKNMWKPKDLNEPEFENLIQYKMAEMKS
jgi:hypothetical protein